MPGKVYLGRPLRRRAALAWSAIVPAVAGPFDVGTVVVRQALRLDPSTAEVDVDGAASDPIPHILDGIPLVVSDIQVYADRPEFTLNPTSCDRFGDHGRRSGEGAPTPSASPTTPRSRQGPASRRPTAPASASSRASP